MIIDLSEWNEYIADDVSPGPIPEGVDLEIMEIITTNAYRDPSNGLYPTGLGFIKKRFFWKIKKKD